MPNTYDNTVYAEGSKVAVHEIMFGKPVSLIEDVTNSEYEMGSSECF